MDCFASLAMTSFHPDAPSRSRGAIRPRFARKFHALKSKGAGNAGCALHPRSRVQEGKKRTRAYRAAEAIRHSLRSGFTAYIALSPAIGLFDTVACEYGCQSPVGMTGLRRLDANH